MIRGNAALKTLAGLENLSSVGGEFQVDGVPALTSLRGLEKLASVGELWINDCPKLTDLHALSSLKSVGIGCSLFRNEKLSACETKWLQDLVEGLGANFFSDDSRVCR
jgi:hypothetical protein